MQGYCRVTPAAFPPGDHSLPTSIGLWSAVLRRSRADLPVVLASFALLASALSLLAAGTLYTSAVTLAGLQRALLAAPAADRAIVVRTKILPERLQAADAVIVPQLQEAIADTGGELAFVLHSSAYADAASDPATVSDLTQFASFQGIDRHAELVDGQWATPGHDPIEATLSQGAAAALGVGTGDHLSLVSRLDPTHKVDVAITGTWRADPSDGYWLADPLDLDGTDKGGQFTTRGPLVVDQADLTSGPLSEALDAQWRAIPDVGGFRPESLDTVATNVDGLLARVNAALPGTNQASISTKLPAILSSIDRSVLVAQAGILLLLVQFGVLAAYAVILVAALLLERRRTETALLRSRGAGTGHLASMAFGEALIVVVPAVIVAPWFAMLLVQAVRLNPAMEGVGLSAPLPGPATFLTAIGGGLIALVALTIPTLASGVSIAGVRAAVGRQAGRTLPQRLGLDLALVVLAVIAMLQLRLYGATLTRNDPRDARRRPVARGRARDRARGGGRARDPDRAAARRARRAGAGANARTDRIAGQPAGRPAAAALHAGGAAPDPRGGPRDVRLRPRRDVDAEPGRSGGLDRRSRRPDRAQRHRRRAGLGAGPQRSRRSRA